MLDEPPVSGSHTDGNPVGALGLSSNTRDFLNVSLRPLVFLE